MISSMNRNRGSLSEIQAERESGKVGERWWRESGEEERAKFWEVEKGERSGQGRGGDGGGWGGGEGEESDAQVQRMCEEYVTLKVK